MWKYSWSKVYAECRRNKLCHSISCISNTYDIWGFVLSSWKFLIWCDLKPYCIASADICINLNIMILIPFGVIILEEKEFNCSSISWFLVKKSPGTKGLKIELQVNRLFGQLIFYWLDLCEHLQACEHQKYLLQNSSLTSSKKWLTFLQRPTSKMYFSLGCPVRYFTCCRCGGGGVNCGWTVPSSGHGDQCSPRGAFRNWYTEEMLRIIRAAMFEFYNLWE